MIKDNLDYNKDVQPNTAKLEELKSKLPEYFTTAGNFDMDKLRDDLKKNNVDELSSGYQLDFIGKDYAKKQAGERPSTVIVPDVENNRKDKNKQSSNLFFTGDNLEVLRHLQNNYQDSIDFIYIDPPYNTGSDGFVYPDDFEYTDQKMKDMFGLDADALKRLKMIQKKATHSAWLSFMYPRLYLAKKLLKNSGAIFISIDDNEQANLKLLMDGIFGEGSFIQEISWRRSDNQPNIGQTAKVKEYIFIYAKSIGDFQMGRLPLSEKAKKEYRYEDTYRGKFRRGILLDKTRGRYVYPVQTKSGKILNGPWMVPEDKLWEMDRQKQIYWTTGGEEQPYSKIYLKDSKGAIPNDFWGIEYGTNQRASIELEKLLEKRLFSFPKPVSLIKNLLNLGTRKESIVLDFFAGSSTTAEAVMQLNAEDGGHRKFIMATSPEKTYSINEDGTEVPTKGGKTAFDAGYRTIDEISRERIVRAAKKIQEENPELSEDFDDGFKHYRVVSPTATTLEDLEYSDDVQQDLLDNMVEKFSAASLTESHQNTVPKKDHLWHGYDLGKDASGKDTILATWLVADGYKFDVETHELDFAGYKATYVDDTRLYLIEQGWSARNTNALVNEIGNNKLTVQTVVVYGYNFDLESLKELKIALQQLDVKVNLNERF